MPNALKVLLEFGGGAELLVEGKVKRHEALLPLPDGASSEEGIWTLSRALGWIRDNLLQERPELFLKDKDSSESELDVRPGILVLVNDADWELVGQTSYVLQDGDTVTFISTLHGG